MHNVLLETNVKSIAIYVILCKILIAKRITNGIWNINSLNLLFLRMKIYTCLSHSFSNNSQNFYFHHTPWPLDVFYQCFPNLGILGKKEEKESKLFSRNAKLSKCQTSANTFILSNCAWAHLFAVNVITIFYD